MIHRHLSRIVIAASLTFVACSVAQATDDSDDVRVTPQEQAIADHFERITAEQRASSDLRMRIVLSISNDVEADRRPVDNGFYGKEIYTAAELYEQARGATDPVLLDLLVRRCGYRTKTEDRCDRVALAKRWTEADTQNQVAWLTLAGLLKERGDTDGARAAFVRAAQASRWHEHYDDVAQWLAASLPKDLTLQELGIGLTMALMRATGAIPIDAMQTLGTYCREPADDLRDSCRRIVDTMVRDTNVLMTLAIAPAFAARAREDAPKIAAYQQKADAAYWYAMHPAVQMDDVIALPDDREARRIVGQLRAQIALGEVRGAEQYLLREKISEREAAQRYVATLPPEQVKRRRDTGR